MLGRLSRFVHWISHRFGWNTGTVETWWEGRQLMVGFRCDGCGKVSGAHASRSARDVQMSTPKPCAHGSSCAALATGFLRRPCPTCPLRQAPVKQEGK